MADHPAHEIPKTYEPDQVESRWYTYWEQHGCFKSVPDQRPAYTIVIPPPNVTGVLHMGHMLNNTIQDVLIRRKRMEGYNACWVPGTDHASIATEAKVVRKLREEGQSKQTLIDTHGYEEGREKFLDEARAWKDKYGGIILHQLRKLGAACDWSRTAYTLDPGYYQDVIDTFIRLYNDGLIYRAERMVNWDPVAKTTLSDEEVIYKETQGKLYYVRYYFADATTRLAVRDAEGNLLEERTYLTVATTRPETILGDTAIAVHPDDPRYTHLVGKQVKVPFTGEAIPIVADGAIDPAFGTGCLKVTPAHAKADYEIYERLKAAGTVINVRNTIDEEGKMYIPLKPAIQTVDGADSTVLEDPSSIWQGLDRFEMRTRFGQWLADNGHLERIEDHTHNVGHSERTDAVIEERPSLQWWVKMKELCQPALEAVLNGEVQLFPDKFVATYRHWMENVKDWCISRQLWWGHRVPAWYATVKKPNVGTGTQTLTFGPYVALTKEEATPYVEADPDYKKLGEGLPFELEQDPDVLDTWFSSWLWPLSVFNGLNDPQGELAYYYPTATLVTAPDILFFWVARMIIAGYYYGPKLGLPREKWKPFDRVYLTGMVRDKQRRKMSKSLGNSPDPLDLIAQYSADGVRMGMLLASPAGNDLLFDESLCDQGRNFTNKIWNAFRLHASLQADAQPGNPTDHQALATRWMHARTAQVAHDVDRMIEEFRLSEAITAVYKLIWDDFCAWYLELMKPAPGAATTTGAAEALTGCFEALMQLLHPFMPFISEEIWQRLRPRSAGESVLLTLLPKPAEPDTVLLADMAAAREAVTALRGLRAERAIPSSQPIDLFIEATRPDRWQYLLPVVARFIGYGQVNYGLAAKPEATAQVLVGSDSFHVPIELDVAAERAKLEEEIRYQEGFLVSVQQKLGNERFVQNAKPDVVERERQKQADAERKLASLRQALAQLPAA